VKCRNRLGKINFGTLLIRGDMGVFFAVVFFIVILSIFTDSFLSSFNIFAVSRTFSLWIIVGFAQMITLIIGHMNLSVGAIGGLAGIATGFLFNSFGSPSWVSVGAGLIVGILCGLINGIIITKTGINAFIVTLATSSVYTGILFGFTHALSYPNIPESYKTIGSGSILFGIVPFLFLIMIGLAIILWILFNYTLIGRRILAVGGNRETARLSGININNITLLVHVLSGFLAAMGGVLFVARLGSAHTSIGKDWLLLSFAIPIIGGTSLEGGAVSIFGVCLGGVLMTIIKNGLVLVGVDPFWEEFFMGLLVLLAVLIDRVRTIYATKKY
jgi:ribose transport system permease protein